MAKSPEAGTADLNDDNRLRYSVSLVKQGSAQFYTLTMPSEVLARTCKVSTRNEDPKLGFQRELDERRANEIANYIDNGMGTIPSSVVLSAQPEAELKIVGRGKTLEFNDVKGAFLILDGQHRVYGFSKAKTSLRVPVVVYNGLSRRDETRLFIDINTKQKPVPSQLLLDIKNLADVETDVEQALRDIFDLFSKKRDSVLRGKMSASDSIRGKINRVTFNQSVKPLLPLFPDREADDVYRIINAYLVALDEEVRKKTVEDVITKPVIFRAFLGFFKPVAQRVVDRFGQEYTPANFGEIVAPVFQNLRSSKLTSPGTSPATLRDHLTDRLSSKLSL
ncbi:MULTISPECIES: DGQHR domain-containing protein [Phaeobacter]|uniref:DGQHR domain-containing protein n=1 Tax=Phaeobacter TaxID=302485 RepID=UPI003A84006B